MDLVHPRCAGLDVHKASVKACVRIAQGKEVQREVRDFDTTTRGLLELRGWLEAQQVSHVAMEATGIYWKPVWHILEGQMDLVLANPAHIRNIPGRKSDVNDAGWIAELLAHGLVRNSFVPPTPIQDLRDLSRTRKQLARQVVQHTQRIQKTLEDANVKLSNVLSDTMGKSGRRILEALVKGESDPEKLLACTVGRLKASRAELTDALQGMVREHHRFLLKLHLDQIAALEEAIRELEARMGESLAPFSRQMQLLKTMPGVSDTVAQTIIAEVGVEMSRFPSSSHLVSWAGLCPGMNESAGKRRSTRIRQGDPWLKTVLVQAAWSAARKKDSYLRSQFLRLKGRRGPKKAIIAVAASMLTAVYHILRNGVEYHDLGACYFDGLNERKRTVRRLVRRLEALGCQVDIRQAA